MTLMISGLLVWSLVHFIPSLSAGLKRKWISTLGENGYMLSFSVVILSSLVLIVLGWRSTTPSYIYSLPDIVRPISIVLMAIAFVFFVAANYPSRIKQFVRHLQLTSIIIWSTAHLLTNGDSRSVLLFGWLGIWAVLEIFLINRREGEWVKEVSVSWGQEAKGIAISLIIFAVIYFAHPYIAGVSI